MVPGVKEIFFDKSSIVYSFTEACLSIGLSGIIIFQVTLGSNLVLLSSNREGFTKGFIASVVIFKNLIGPSVALGVSYGLWQCGTFGDNIVMAYLVFISFCCPSALVLMVMTQMLDYGTHEVSLLMLWIYCSSIFGLIIWTYLFFIIFSVV